MEINGKVHCFFEQSGIFKNEFIKLGIPAEDYDIQNNFGETDHIIDLFAEIEKGYDNEESIFDKISEDDLIIAFFPCIYFCENNRLYFRGEHMNQRKFAKSELIRQIIERSENRQYFYAMLLKLFEVVEVNGLRFILENPYHPEHYLYDNFPYRPTIIDKNRAVRGDYFRKPSQFWFVNCTNTTGLTEQINTKIKAVASGKPAIRGGLCSEDRSMISPDYARNFICDFIIGKKQQIGQLSLF